MNSISTLSDNDTAEHEIVDINTRKNARRVSWKNQGDSLALRADNLKKNHGSNVFKEKSIETVKRELINTKKQLLKIEKANNFYKYTALALGCCNIWFIRNFFI